MPIAVQQSVRGLGPMILDYIASSAEKMDTLPVGVKKKMVINSMTEVQEDLRGDTRPQARKKQSSSIQITLSSHRGVSSIDRPMRLRKESIVKGRIRLSIREAFDVSCGE